MPLTTLLFDAGNTLIIEQPEQTRPMLEWPTIQAVPGVAGALQQLQPLFTLVVASNADMSTGALALKALARLELDRFFSYSFTAVDLKLRKPDPAFFLAILERCGAQPQDACMVGDLFDWDIAGAKSAGLKAAWYNLDLKPALDGIPVQDLDFASMQDLPALLACPMLPDIPTCEAWLVEQGATPRLLRHVRAVAFAAYQLACNMRLAGHAVDPLLVHRGALLHDLDKFNHHEHGLEHGEYAGFLLEQRGWPALAGIARRHLIGFGGSQYQPVTLEEKVVNYADKLVEEDQLVGLDKRISALMRRYPAYASRMQASLPSLHSRENEMCSLAGTSPAELIDQLHAKWPAAV